MRHQTRERIWDAASIALALLQLVIWGALGAVAGVVIWKIVSALELIAEGGACR